MSRRRTWHTARLLWQRRPISDLKPGSRSKRPNSTLSLARYDLVVSYANGSIGGKPLHDQKYRPQSNGFGDAKNILSYCPKSPLRVPLVDEGTNLPECPAAIKMLFRRGMAVKRDRDSARAEWRQADHELDVAFIEELARARRK